MYLHDHSKYCHFVHWMIHDFTSCEWSLIMRVPLFIRVTLIMRVTLVIQATHHSSDSSFKWRSSCEWSLVMRVITHHASDRVTLIMWVTLVIRATRHSSDDRHARDHSSCEWSLVMQMMIKHSIDCSLAFEIALKKLTKYLKVLRCLTSSYECSLIMRMIIHYVNYHSS